jgi:Zn ribbon nucleic-acid-binding protein
MKCPMCTTENSMIIEKNDSNYRSVRCLACGYTQLLKNLKGISLELLGITKKTLIL